MFLQRGGAARPMAAEVGRHTFAVLKQLHRFVGQPDPRAVRHVGIVLEGDPDRGTGELLSFGLEFGGNPLDHVKNMITAAAGHARNTGRGHRWSVIQEGEDFQV